MDTQQLQLADLPELDSVTSGGRGLRIVSMIGLAVVSLFFGALVAAIYALIRVEGQHAQFTLVESLVVGVAGAVVSALLMLRTNWFEYQWTTDSTGLTIKGLSRTRRIDWSQVIDVKAKAMAGDKVSCTVRTTVGKITLSDMFDDHSGLLAASLYQHLRRYGKAAESILTRGARTFWMPISREVPNEMDWHDPKPPEWSVTLAVTVLVLVAVPVIYYLGPRVDWGQAWNFLHQFAAAIIPLGYRKFRERLIAAHVVSVRHDGIEMRTARRLIYLPWREVKYVQWQQQNTFTIGKSTYRDVAIIRYRRNDPDSAAVVLSIIRQLRAVHHTPPVVIPAPMRSMLIGNTQWQSTDVSKDAPLQVRPMKAQLLVIAGVAIAFEISLVTSLWKCGTISGIIFCSICILNAIGIISMIHQATTIYRADSEGITVTSFGKRKLIKWHDVTSYTVSPVSSTIAAKRVLKDFSGHTLFWIVINEGVRPDHDRFLAYLDAKLAPVRQNPTPTCR